MDGPRVDSLIRRTAARQAGVVARAQLVRAGAPPHAVDFRLRRGHLERLHRGVYRVGPVVGIRSAEWAALLSCSGRPMDEPPTDAGGTSGPDPIRSGLALSHRTAGSLWDLVPPQAPDAPVDVSGPATLRARSGVRVHRVGHLPPGEVVRRDGLPVTVPARTLVDLGSAVDPDTLERAVARAIRRKLVSPRALREAAAAHGSRRGGRALRRLLARIPEPRLTRSTAEARLLELVREGGLPRPQVNAVVCGLEVDFLWRRARLVVEVDGFAYHGGRDAFERDRRRDRILVVEGYRVLRVTWRQLDGAPSRVLVQLAQALAPAR